jgi:diguanylate cyclase (GGDEF)-like protein
MKSKFFTNFKIKHILKVYISIIFGVFFVIWALILHKNISINFPMIALPIIILCYFFKSTYATILTCLAVVVAFIEIIDFVVNSGEPLRVICLQARLVSLECMALIVLYVIFEMYKNRYKEVENALLQENNNIALDIMLKKSEILKNNKEIEKLSKKIENFVNLGNIIQFFHKFSNENEMFFKIQNIAISFMKKGSWEVKKYTEDDVFAQYIRKENSILIIDDLPKDKRFKMKDSKKKSILVAPININGKFWGTLEGVSYINNFFYNEDVEKLLLFSSSISKIISNYYLYAKLKALSIVDVITGCYRQSFFKERFNEELAYAKRNNFPLTVGILDIDFFKNINDKYGHLATDSVLQQFASILRSTFREIDILARYGGDEFSFLMTHTNANDALKILEQLRATLEKTKFCLPLEESSPINVNVTASFGFVSLTKNNATLNPEEFIKNADKALYRAKKLGRNRIEEYNGY